MIELRVALTVTQYAFGSVPMDAESFLQMKLRAEPAANGNEPISLQHNLLLPLVYVTK